MFHSAQRAPPQFENHVQIFHPSSTDDERTGPGYMDQLACEQKKSEWIVASIKPAKDLTRTKEPEFMFLHAKDFWFRSIWIDLHQALTIDRVSSRDRAPIGLVRCICKDDYVKGQRSCQIQA